MTEADGPFRFTLLLAALDEVAVYNRALAPQEIAALATAAQAQE